MDFLLENNDIKDIDGDFVTGDSLSQEVRSIMIVPPGQFRENGYLGMNLVNLIDDDESVDIKAEIKKMLKLDGKKLKTYTIVNDKIQLDAEYI